MRRRKLSMLSAQPHATMCTIRTDVQDRRNPEGVTAYHREAKLEGLSWKNPQECNQGFRRIVRRHYHVRAFILCTPFVLPYKP